MKYAAILLALALVACERAGLAGKQGQAIGTVVSRTPGGEPVGLHRYREWGPASRIIQGAQPEGEEAFLNMRALGVTVVLSVDGSLPDVEGAQKQGLKYAHVPIGYDGITRAQALQIVKTIRDAEGKVYIHCHHGKHRGPAGAMIGRMAIDRISNEEAVAGLKISETSPQYTGLYRDVSKFVPPTKAELDATPDPPARVAPKGLQAAMVDVSHRFDFIKKSKAEKWQVPADNPDISPPHEARMLWEAYREARRLDEAKKLGEKFLALLQEAEKSASDLEQALRASDPRGTAAAYKATKLACTTCHAEHRN